MWLCVPAGRLFGLIAQGQGHAESQAARQADSPSRSTPTGIAPHEPALHSEAGRQQAAALDSQAARHSGSPQGVADAPEEPALKSDIGQQQAGIVEGREPHHACATEGGEITSEGPEEPSLRSGVAHRAAAAAKEGMPGCLHAGCACWHATEGPFPQQCSVAHFHACSDERWWYAVNGYSCSYPSLT